MIKLLKKQPTVEQIHAEFDSAEERILNECDAILAQLQIPTESKIERKADMLINLGFVNSEVVKQANSIKENQKEIKNKIDITSLQASYIRKLKVKYPKEKFITIDELERICEKYNLIHAPVSNYIKDIPEKNVLEMTNCKKLDIEDKIEETFLVTEVDSLSDFKKLLKILGKNSNNYEITNSDVIKAHKEYRNIFYEDDTVLTHWLFGKTADYMVFYDLKKEHNLDFRIKKYEKIDKTGLFIAAPKSHFNLKGLDKKSKYGFFTVTVKEVKDPVVFEYCKNNICRIITKWGTEDDQSYLDPILFDEKLN
jgi:DNA-binding Xre family transcriptional regulator